MGPLTTSYDSDSAQHLITNNGTTRFRLFVVVCKLKNIVKQLTSSFFEMGY